MGCPAWFVVLEPWFVVLIGAELGDTAVVDAHVDDDVAGVAGAWGVVVHNGGRGVDLVVWGVLFVALGVQEAVLGPLESVVVVVLLMG